MRAGAVEPEFVHSNTGGTRRWRCRWRRRGLAGSHWGGGLDIHSAPGRSLWWWRSVESDQECREEVQVANIVKYRRTRRPGWQLRAVAAVAAVTAGPQETQSVTHVVPAQLSLGSHRNLGLGCSHSQTRLGRGGRGDSWYRGGVVLWAGRQEAGQHGMTAWRFLFNLDNTETS